MGRDRAAMATAGNGGFLAGILFLPAREPTHTTSTPTPIDSSAEY